MIYLMILTYCNSYAHVSNSFNSLMYMSCIESKENCYNTLSIKDENLFYNVCLKKELTKKSIKDDEIEGDKG